MNCPKCGYSDNGTGDMVHACNTTFPYQRATPEQPKGLEVVDIPDELHDWWASGSEDFYEFKSLVTKAMSAHAEQVRAETIDECWKVCEAKEAELRALNDPDTYGRMADGAGEAADSVRALGEKK
jgi:hypothetical protein